MTRRARMAGAIACALWLGGSPAAGQSGPAPLPGRFEVSAGPVWGGAAAFGTSDASLTGPAGDRYRLFSTSSQLTRATGAGIRFGGRVTRLAEAELVASYATPHLSTSIGSDAENAASIIASERVTQFSVGGAGVVHLPFLRLGRRILPFATAGAGYLRELHEGATLVQTGRTYHVGAGLKMPLSGITSGRWTERMGVRAEVSAMVRSGGIALDGRAHTAPVVSAFFFARL